VGFHNDTTNIDSRYGVSNIRELVGHKVDLNFIESNPAVRLEKD
jgi:phenylalanyl-tRNA synthetase alpha chain